MIFLRRYGFKAVISAALSFALALQAVPAAFAARAAHIAPAVPDAFEEFVRQPAPAARAPATAVAFASDVPSDWAKEEVEKARAYGLIPDGMYHSFVSDISRAEFCRLVMALFTRVTSEPEKSGLKSAFTDTDDISILNAYELGIVKGVGGGYFLPETAITRQEIAVMLYNAINAIDGATGKNILKNASAALTFIDHALMADWAVTAIGSLRNNEIMIGDDKNYFNPLDNTSKEMAFMLVERIYLIYAGLDAKKSFPAAYTGEILMRIKGCFTDGDGNLIIGDVYEQYPDMEAADLSACLSEGSFTVSGGETYLIDRAESLSESAAIGYTGEKIAGGNFYPIYVLKAAAPAKGKLYIIYEEPRFRLYKDKKGGEPFLYITFSDVIFTAPGETEVIIGAADGGDSRDAADGARAMTFEELLRNEPELLDAHLWRIRLTKGKVTRITAHGTL